MVDKPFNRKEYPYLLLERTVSLFNEVRKYVQDNNDILKVTQRNEFDILVEDTSYVSNFTFQIQNPELAKNSLDISYEFHYNPYNGVNLNSFSGKGIPKLILERLKGWTKLIRKYNEIQLTPEDSILQEYEEEFYTHFEIVEDDADFKPFNLEQQILIDKVYDAVIVTLEEDPETNQDLIIEAKEIKDVISTSTKKEIVSRSSKLYAKIRRFTVPVLKKFASKLNEEMIERGVDILVNKLGDLMNLLIG